MYSELKTVQEAELCILKEIKRVCEKHKIQYFLTGGTMLGAVRHKGFIPWDDDIDIAMAQEEYVRFLDIAPKELDSHFFLDNESTNPEYGLVFSKVRMRNTKFVELKGNPKAIHNEVFVDVFPYFYVSNIEIERKRNGRILSILTQLLLLKAGYRVWRGEGFLKMIKFVPLRVASILTSTTSLRMRINNITNRYIERTQYTCPNNGSRLGYLHWLIPRKVFDEYIDIEFEDETYPIPKDFQTCLTTFYGNSFMELPPEDKRITHRPIQLDLNGYWELNSKGDQL